MITRIAIAAAAPAIAPPAAADPIATPPTEMTPPATLTAPIALPIARRIAIKPQIDPIAVTNVVTGSGTIGVDATPQRGRRSIQATIGSLQPAARLAEQGADQQADE